jgi:serine/threonine protein kinase/tetratricopeptide (TPR) repeat protein
MNRTTSSVESIMSEAVEIAAADERQAYLDRSCAGNPELRAQVERLVANHFRAGSFLERPAAGLETAPLLVVHDDVLGTKIGPYKLLEQIGEGGMGLVFVAEQQQPVRRSVALKLIKPGMDSKQVVARFEAERQALALMDHPNIAKVLDAGTTEAGRPYFVMELVRGIPITEFCDQARLTVRQRLEIFVQVCRAVQHAHTKGVIHRDLKPTNVLVTSHDGIPVPLVIDFGVAKALGQRLTENTLHTAFSQMVGTPLYMSPEQAEFNQLGVDTRSDVYSLGVLLYELLTGVTPFDQERLRTVGHDEFRRILREEEPPRPSARLSTLTGVALSTASQRRSIDPRKLTQALHGELDWIVLKSLEKDRNRRYESASGFAGDVQRYLNDEAVEACPPSAVYRMRKFMRRNKASMLIAVCVFITLAIAAGSVGWIAGDRKSRRQQAAQSVNNDLAEAAQLQRQAKWREARAVIQGAEGLLASAGGDDSTWQRCRDAKADVEMLQKLERAALEPTEKVARWGEFQSRPFDYASADPLYRSAFQEYGLPVLDMDEHEAAERIAKTSIAAELLVALVDWATITPNPADGERLMVVATLMDHDSWEQELFAAVGSRDETRTSNLSERAEASTEHLSILRYFGGALGHKLVRNNPELAVALLRKFQREFPHDFWTNLSLAIALTISEKPQIDEALAFCRVAVALRPECAAAVNSLGILLHTKADFMGAECAFREAVRLQPDSISLRYNLANALKFLGRASEAADIFRQVIAAHPESAEVYCNLAEVLQVLGQFPEALESLKRGHELGSRQADWKHESARWVKDLEILVRLDAALSRVEASNRLPASADENVALAYFCMKVKHDPSVAIQFYEKAFALKDSWPNTDAQYDAACAAVLASRAKSPDAGALPDQRRIDLRRQALTWLHHCLAVNQKEIDEGGDGAYKHVLRALEHWQRDIDLENVRTPASWSEMPEPERQQWKQLWQEVETLRARCERLIKAPTAWNALIEAAQATGQTDELLIVAKARRDVLAQQVGPHNPETINATRQLADAYDRADLWAPAADTMKQVVDAKKVKPGPDHPETFEAMKRLGGLYRRAGNWTEGLALYKELTERAIAKHGPDNSDALGFQQEEGLFLSSSGRFREAIVILEQVLERQRMLPSPNLSATLQYLGAAYYWDGRYASADRVTQEVLDIIKKAGKPETAAEVNTLALHGMCLIAQMQFDEAEKTLRVCLALPAMAKQPPWHLGRVQNLLGVALAGQGKPAEAEKLLVDGYEGMKRHESKIPAPWKRYFNFAHESVLRYFESTGATEKAKLWREKAPKSSLPSK